MLTAMAVMAISGADAAAGTVEVGQIVSTKMACLEDTQEAVFTEMLQSVAGYELAQDGTLALELADNEGEMVFAANN